jgi:hypothetical protein
MKDKRHIKKFNEHQENLNISDVISSKILKQIDELDYKETFFIFNNQEDLQEGRTDWETMKEHYLDLCYLVENIKSFLRPNIDTDEDDD